MQVTALGEGLGQKNTRSREDGRFEICGLAPGTYMVSATDLEDRMRNGGAFSYSPSKTLTVEVKENETTEVDFAPPADAGSIAGAIRGVSGMASIVVRPPSAAPAGMEAFGVMLSGDSAGGFAMAQQDGPFSIAEVTAGEYVIEVYVMPKIGPGFDPTAMINSPPKAVVQQKITVTAGETTTVELTLPAAESTGEEPATP